MLRSLALPALAGLTGALPVPVAVVLTSLAQDLSLVHPGVVASGLAPLAGAATLVGISLFDGRLRRERARWQAQRRALEERRRRLADEAAQLQALELGLVADLEEAEAEIDAMQAVSTSLATALGDSLGDLEERLAASANALANPELARLAHQVEELMELVRDVDRFASSEVDLERPSAFCLADVVDETLAAARAERTGALSWSLDPSAPAWAPGSPERLRCILRAAVRAGAAQARGPLHLELALIDRGGVRGLDVRWSHDTDPTERHGVTDGLGARLAEALGEPPVAHEAGSITWWMPQDQPGSVVPAPLPPARVLLAASEAPTRARVRRLLSRWGLEVTTARSCEEALARLELQPADVVLIDLEGESLTTLDRIRRHDTLRELPVLLLGPVAENLVWLPGGDGEALTRPVRHEGLLAGVEAALEHRGEVPQSAQGTHIRRRVLVYEPNPAVSARLVRLGADVGCRVHAVATPEALAQARLEPWDLVLVGGELDALPDSDASVVRMLARPDASDERAVGIPGDAAEFLAMLADNGASTPQVRAMAGRYGS